ncbi:MAG TPA: non-heme iron oxygenase ferredoxin subunit [Acetobacteraceae bacterium]|jgi:nitrite reductase/ring-hydroxylating ferredoxin subunit
MSESESWIRVASVADVAKGTAVPVETMGLSLAVYHLDDGTICVTDNICTHAFAMLTDGWLEGDIIECPLHAGQFNVRNGQGQGAPIDTDLRVFEVRVDGGEILISLPD